VADIFFYFFSFSEPPRIAAFQFHEELVAGNRLQSLCSVVSGETPMTIVWRKDGAALPRNDPRIQVQTHEAYSMLLISELAAHHAGRYTCVASNDAASANYSADLVVKGNHQHYLFIYRALLIWKAVFSISQIFCCRCESEQIMIQLNLS